MRKILLVELVVLLFFTNFINGQSNEYPTSGDITIRNYSPSLILQRSADSGGFTSGIQTKLLNGDNNWFFGNLLTNSWVVSKGNHENAKLTVLSDGNVGIGTIEPKFKLDVVGAGHFKVDDDNSAIGGLTIETKNGTNLKIGGASTYSWIQSHNSLPLYINELGNNIILNPRSGNVGIGTINPLAKLEVNGGSILVRNTFNTDNSSSIMIGQSIKEGNNTTFGTAIGTIIQSAGLNIYGMQFFTQESYLTGQTEKMRILVMVMLESELQQQELIN